MVFMAAMKISIVLVFVACHQTQSQFSRREYDEFVAGNTTEKHNTTEKYSTTEKYNTTEKNNTSEKDESAGNQAIAKVDLARNERGIGSEQNLNEESNNDTTVLRNMGEMHETSTIKISTNLRDSVAQGINKNKHSTHGPIFKPTSIDEIKSNGSNMIQTMISEELQKHLKQVIKSNGSNLIQAMISEELQKHLKQNEPTNSKSPQTAEMYPPHIDGPINNDKNIVAKEVENNKDSLTHPKMRNFLRHTQGRNTQGEDDKPCEGRVKEDDEKLNSSGLKENQGINSTRRPEGEIEEAASNILPNVRNTTEKTASSIEMNTQNTTAKPAKNSGHSTILPLNNTTNGTSTPKPVSKKQKSEKWKKLLKFLGSAIGVFTLVGGAFYIVHSVTLL